MHTWLSWSCNLTTRMVVPNFSGLSAWDSYSISHESAISELFIQRFSFEYSICTSETNASILEQRKTSISLRCKTSDTKRFTGYNILHSPRNCTTGKFTSRHAAEFYLVVVLRTSSPRAFHRESIAAKSCLVFSSLFLGILSSCKLVFPDFFNWLTVSTSAKMSPIKVYAMKRRTSSNNLFHPNQKRITYSRTR